MILIFNARGNLKFSFKIHFFVYELSLKRFYKIKKETKLQKIIAHVAEDAVYIKTTCTIFLLSNCLAIHMHCASSPTTRNSFQGAKRHQNWTLRYNFF